MINLEKQKKSILIEAHNVHTGGALSLLTMFIGQFDTEGLFTKSIVLDTRCSLVPKADEFIYIRRVKPNFFSRTINAIRVCFFGGCIFCFGNLPPIISRSNEIIVFLHNALYFRPDLIKKFPLKARVRLTFESIFFRLRCHSVHKFLVQTPHMRDSLCKLSIDPKKIIVAPFADISVYEKSVLPGKTFICVSSGDSHKNIHNLVLAWIKLHQCGVSPKLFLTLSSISYSNLVKWLDFQIITFDLNIENLGVIKPNEINKIYQDGATLIFPSLTESLGLPLIEARETGVDILAPELDFVRDIVDPVETFDPNSPTSIARAVKRYLKVPRHPIQMKSISELTNDLFKLHF